MNFKHYLDTADNSTVAIKQSLDIPWPYAGIPNEPGTLDALFESQA